MDFDRARQQRILKQHVTTDQLLGVMAVPVGAVVTEVEAGGAEGVGGGGGGGEVVGQPVDVHGTTFRGDKAVRLEQIRLDHEQNCQTPLRDMQAPGAKIVFGEGNPDADLMFVGEGPGQTEAKLGRPFVGRAGELLDKMIVAMGQRRQTVYIANVVKFRPPNNRTPTPEEISLEAPYLIDQIMTIEPRVIVALGGAATKYMLNTTRGITSLRGRWYDYHPSTVGGNGGAGSSSGKTSERAGGGTSVGASGGVPLMPTFHPAFLLRQYTTDNRKKVWADLQEVMRKLS